ncbi:MAG: hypothetical protein VB875_06200, partial [Pirellulales bacterium]
GDNRFNRCGRVPVERCPASTEPPDECGMMAESISVIIEKVLIKSDAALAKISVWGPEACRS